MSGWGAVAWLPAAVWVYLLLARGRFWLPTPRLGRWPDPAEWPAVAVVVPARNEEEMLARTLPPLLAQDYPGPARVILVDDCSDDGTADLAARTAGAGRLDLRVVRGRERPPGWVGKTWALHQGTEAAEDVEYLLFTDADIEHPPDSLRRLVAAAVGDQRDLVSLMARLRAQTGWERLIVPAFVYFFAQLYPFRPVGRARSRTAAAAGGCILVRRTTLVGAGGVAAIAGAVIDDVSLGRAIKRSGGSIWLGFADEVASIRPYPVLGDLWDMVARSAFTQLRYSLVAVAGAVAGLVVIYLGPLVVVAAGAATGAGGVVVAGAAAWLLMTATYLPMIRYYRLPVWWAATLPVAATLYGAMTVDSARRHRRGAGAAWKGRTYAEGTGAVSG